MPPAPAKKIRTPVFIAVLPGSSCSRSPSRCRSDWSPAVISAPAQVSPSPTRYRASRSLGTSSQHGRLRGYDSHSPQPHDACDHGSLGLATRHLRAGAGGFLRLSQFARRIRPTRASRSPLRCPPVSYGYDTRSQSQTKDRARTWRATASRARARTCTSVRT